MHELPAMKSVHEIILRHAYDANASRVLAVSLEIGALSDLQDEWVHRYLDHLSSGTIAEGASVEIVRVPGVMRCSLCGAEFEVDSLPVNGLSCVSCGVTAVTVISGRAIEVKAIEVV